MTMKWLLKVLSYLAVASSSSGAFSISCSSEFTPPTGSFCVGIPLQCTVMLSTHDCINTAGQAVPLSSGDLSLQVIGSDVGTISPDFNLSQSAFQLTVIVDHHPISSVGTVRVQIVSSKSNCSFNVGTGDLPVSPPTACNAPLSINLVSSDPIYPAEVEGGNIISLDLEVMASSHAVQDLTVALGNSHPGLVLLSNTSATVSDPMVVIESYDTDIHDLSTGNFVPLLSVSNLPQLQTLSVSLSFQVQPFVRPKAALYFSFHAFYYISSYGMFTFQVSTPQIREYVVVSPTIRENYTLTLPYYNNTDRVRFTFPPHVGDRFRIRVPIYIPCVSTNLTVEISIPEFWSEVYTFFFTNVTDISTSTTPNTLSLPPQCAYTDLSTFDPDACYMGSSGGTIHPIITTSEKAAPGVDTVVIEFGEIWRTVTVGEACAGDMPDPACNCDEEQMTNITLTGVILTEVPCENQTLADNITTVFSYTSDISTWTTSAGEPSNEIPVIAKNGSIDHERLAINASLPAIDLPISSHTGDAGDAFNVTFGVKHNRAYSSFTAYDLNYTFSIDPRLDPEENITICMYNTSEVPTFCEEVPFINYTIIRYGFHDVFSLNFDRVELTLGVTIIQEVAPSISFSNPGDTEFRSQPEDNPWDLTPVICTNESSGSVRIHPVVLDPWFVHWSDVESTLTESPTSTHYVTINEQFNMTILACMPESFTSINLFVLLPEISSVPLVTVNDAYVTFVGSELHNTTLFEGDSLNSTENITLNDAQTAITFFFGPEVLIPKDNILINTEQCFEIGLHCTVSNHPSLVDGEQISYQAYVQTDFDIRTSSRYITLTIEEPELPIFSGFLSEYDAGDPVNLVLAVVHSSVTAYRLNLTVDYPTEYFFIDLNDTDAVQLYKDGILQPNSTDIDHENGTVVFRTDSLAPRQVFVVVMTLTVTNSVENAQSYVIPHYLDWHNLPYGLEGGRYYNTSGEQVIPIKTFQLSMAYSTSDENTPGNMVQLQEYISVNVSVTIPEGISPVTVQVSYIDAMPGDYPLIIDHGEVIHIGASISNQLVLVGDTHVNSSRITLNSSSVITFELGQSIINMYDNVVDAGDMIILNVGAYISNTGTRSTDQIITLRGEILEPPSADDMIELELIHPQLQLSAFNAVPSGPWDGGDDIVLSVTFAHMPTTGSVAYDVLISVEFEGGDALSNLSLLHNSFEPSGCSVGDEEYTMVDSHTVKLSHLLVACTAEISLSAQLQDTDVVSGENINIDASLNEYYATTTPSINSRMNYGQGQTLTISMESVVPQLSMNFTTSDVNTPGNIIQLEELISVNVSITLPEGLIPSLTVQVSQIEMLTGGHFVQIVQGEVVHVGQYINNLLLSVGDNASSGNITVTQNSHITFNFGQNILNTHDNVVDSDDVIIVHIEAYISANSTELENQMITFRGEILEVSSAQKTIQFELVHPQLQLNNFSVEPSGPWDGGDDIILSITFSHIVPITGYVAYDVLIVVEFEGGDALSNLTLLTDSFVPRGCSSGNEEYFVTNSHKVMLTHFLSGCTAEISLAAQLPDTSIIAGENITLVASLDEYYATSSSSNSMRTNYAQGQTLTLSVGSKTPQLSIELSTSDEYTPGSIIQLQEIICLNVSVTLPEGLTSSLTVQLSQVGTLSPNYTVSVTRGEIIHVGESINLTLSEGDTISNSSAVTFTDTGIAINFGQNILNTHDNVIDSGDMTTVLIEVYVSTSDTEPTNQSAIFRAEILEHSSAEGTIQFELVHPKLQLSDFHVEPSGPLDSGDSINLYVTFNHEAGGFVAYDVLLLLELDGGGALSNLTLLRGSLEPNGCSPGDEEFTVGDSNVTLSKFLLTCRAELSFTASLPDLSVIAGQNITILNSLVSYYVTPGTSVSSRIPYGTRQTLSFSSPSVKVQQTLNTSVSESLDTLDVLHTVVFPEGRTLGVTVGYTIVTSGSSSTINITQKNFTIEAIEVNPFTDAAEVSISNLGNIFNPSNNQVDENDTAVITSRLDITKRINFTLLATTTYGISDSLSVYSEACFQFLDTKVNIIERDDVVWVVLVLFFGIFIGISITVICFILRILRKKRRKKTVAPALIAAIMGKREGEDQGIFATIKTKRPLFSSLLMALPVEQWHKRDDTYECTEAEYISEVEGDLFHLEGVLISAVVQRILETQTSLSKDRVIQLKSSFLAKANHLRTTLRNGVAADMQGISLEYGANKILKGEKLAEEQEKHMEQLKEHLPLDMDSSADALDQLSLDNEREREELLSQIEVEMKEAEQEVVHQYMSHYLLGLKAIAGNLLHDIPRSNNIINKLNDEIDRVSKYLLEESSLQEDLSLERNERQKKALLQKKLVDERDMKWKSLVLEETDKNVDEMQQLGVISMEDRPDILNGMKDKFIAEFETLQSERDESEVNINNKACNTLKEAELELAENCRQHGSSDVDTEIRQWHAHQLKREDVLRQIETDTIDELSNCWKEHEKKRTQLIENHVSGLSVLFLSKGMQLRDCDRILREHAQSRRKLKEELEASRLIQMAKFQARLDQHKERLAKEEARNQELHTKKREMEKKILQEGKESLSDIELMEQYHNDVADLQKSLALEKLRVHLKTKEKLLERKKRKFEAMQRKYLQAVQQNVDSSSKKEALQNFLDQRKEVAMEIDIRGLEEERRKAEEDLAKEKEMMLKEVTDQAASLLRNLEMEQEEEISAIKENHNTYVKLRAELENLTPNPVDKPSFAVEAGKLLEGYKEQMTKISEQLEEEKKKSVIELERKMRQRRMQRERTVMELTVQDEPPLPGIKNSKFKEVVCKVMLDFRMKQLQQHYTKELSDALEKLEQNYHSKRNEAFEKLERKFEVHLTKVGRLSQEGLVDFFKKLDTWQSEPPTAEELQTGRRRMSSVISKRLPPIITSPGRMHVDSLLGHRQRQGELPPLAALSRRRGTIS